MFIGQKILYSLCPQTFAGPLCPLRLQISIAHTNFSILAATHAVYSQNNTNPAGIPSSACSLGVYCHAKADAGDGGQQGNRNRILGAAGERSGPASAAEAALHAPKPSATGKILFMLA